SAATPSHNRSTRRSKKGNPPTRSYTVVVGADMDRVYGRPRRTHARMGPSSSREGAMSESIYRVTEVIGTSTESWEDAAKHAVETAAATLRDLRIGEVVKLDVTIDDGHVTHYRARVAISFKYEHGN